MRRWLVYAAASAAFLAVAKQGKLRVRGGRARRHPFCAQPFAAGAHDAATRSHAEPHHARLRPENVCSLDRARRAPEADAVLLRVSDDGPGIAPEFAQHLFEPFSTTKPAGKAQGSAWPSRGQAVPRRHL